MLSKNYKNWISTLDQKTCVDCKSKHGKIYLVEEIVGNEPPLHPRCRCFIEWVKVVVAGTASTRGIDGADWWLKQTGELPDYYVFYGDAIEAGWNPKEGNFAFLFPDKMIYGGKFENRKGLLPTVPGRIWYEADINYSWGYRGSDRVVFSNDGLIFVTYDHYNTFQEII